MRIYILKWLYRVSCVTERLNSVVYFWTWNNKLLILLHRRTSFRIKNFLVVSSSIRFAVQLKILIHMFFLALIPYFPVGMLFTSISSTLLDSANTITTVNVIPSITVFFGGSHYLFSHHVLSRSILSWNYIFTTLLMINSCEENHYYIFWH